MNDVAGCADSVRYGAIPLPVADAEVAAGTADIVGDAAADGIDPIVPPMADMDVTGTAGVPGAICPVGVEQVTTVPGVVGRAMAVLPMVETCAKQAEQFSSSMPVVNSKRRIAIRLPSPACPPMFSAPRPCRLPRDSPSD